MKIKIRRRKMSQLLQGLKTYTTAGKGGSRLTKNTAPRKYTEEEKQQDRGCKKFKVSAFKQIRKGVINLHGMELLLESREQEKRCGEEKENEWRLWWVRKTSEG